MFKSLKYVAAVLAFGLFGATAANAASVNFVKPSGNAKTATTFDFVGSDGVNFTASALANGNPSKVYWGSKGLGIKSSFWDIDQIDNYDDSETLVLQFDNAIEITSISFNRVGFNLLEWKNDEYKLAINGGTHGGEIPGGHLFDTGSGTVWFDSLTATTKIALSGDDLNDAFKVGGLSYARASAAAVPLPPAVWSGIAMIAVSGAYRSRRKLASLISA